VHSEYSLLDSSCQIASLAARAAEFDQPALALTDHGVLSGALEHYKACKLHGIKPIIGCEVYYVDDHAHRPEAESDSKVELNHLTLLAVDDRGYRNLVKLSSLGYLEGLVRGKPAVDMGQLQQHASGLIALTGCLASRFCRRIVDGPEDEARQHADDLVNAFGRDNVYFEVQKNGLREQTIANAGIVKIAREMGGKLVGTGDVHYLRREDYARTAALLCVQTNSTLTMPKMTFDTNEFYLKDSEAMASAFAEWPEALQHTLEIAGRATVEIPMGEPLLPRFLTEGHDEKQYLRDRVFAGLADRFGSPPPRHAVARVDYELEVIDRLGCNAYFLILWDVVKWAKDNGVAVGPGRGAAVGSAVAYCLRITDVDPLRHDLLFERFLNPERVSMPDIDIDFSVRGRERVYKYVTEKYGKESVAQIITFGKMKPRAAARAAARVLGHEYAIGDRVAKLIPDPIMGRAPGIEECLAAGQPLRAEVDRDPQARKIIDVAQGLEGIMRNSSIHAAAVVVADRPLTDVVPLQLAQANPSDERGERVYRTVTQFSMKQVEELGLLKVDFLGLRNLDLIEDALDIVTRSTGERPGIHTIPMDDAKTYEMLAEADSVGVFQFESEGMREALRLVRPTEFDDLVALNALYRPGGLEHIPAYARGKRDPSAVAFLDERLKPILGKTHGVLVYQEQGMRIAQDLAGFSPSMADDLRKAIGKRNYAAVDVLEPQFRDGCGRNGVAPEVVEWLWAALRTSADFSFHQGHASAYALISYRSAWLKANHTAAFMGALIASVDGTRDKAPQLVARCEASGIAVRPPDVNVPAHELVAVDGCIRFGLGSVKGVSRVAIEAICAARAAGPFRSLNDLCDRCGSSFVSRAELRRLIRCGACDSLESTRVGMLRALAAASPGEPLDEALLSLPEFSTAELRSLEREGIASYWTSDAARRLERAQSSSGTPMLASLENRVDEVVLIAGVVTQVRHLRTRSDSAFVILTATDYDTNIDLFIGEWCFDYFRDWHPQVDDVVLVSGRVDRSDTVVVEAIEPFELPAAF
jgi:DNA polymerase-3 subunit alpha